MQKLSMSEAVKRIPNNIEIIEFNNRKISSFFCTEHNYSFKGHLGVQCKFCKGSMVDNDTFLYKLKKLEIESKPQEEFIDSYTPINFLCSCGKIFKKRPDKFIKKPYCSSCLKKTDKRYTKDSKDSKDSKKYKYTPKDKFNKEYFINELKIKGIKNTMLGKYKNLGTKIKFNCIYCNREYMAAPSSILKKRSCGCLSFHYHNKAFYTGKKTILYYIEFEGIYKVGLTLYTKNVVYDIVTKRFHGKKVTILDYVVKDCGSSLWDIEKKLVKDINSINKNETSLYSGYTEMSKDKFKNWEEYINERN